MALDKLITRFQSAERQVRLEALLDASNRLPPLPDRLGDARDREAHRIVECQSPVFLWVEREDGVARIYADAPREAPTVRGFVSLLIKHLDGEPLTMLAQIPGDLLSLLRLDEALGMMRTQGLTGVVRRLKAAGAELARGS